jgi:thiamine biosynthesis lipoprotein
MPSSKSKTKPRPDPAVAPAALAFEAIGTAWRIDIADHRPPLETGRLQQAVQERIAAFDKNYSRFRPDSLVARMSQQAGAYELPTDARPLLDLYRDLYKLTDGQMTPLIGQTLSDAGYDAAYSLKPGKPQSPPAWDEALVYDFPRLTLKQPALLDFGAAGKGYLVDIIAELLEEQGVRGYCVDAGGDMRAHGSAPLRVGLEHPDDPSLAIGVAELQNQALCGSAGNRRAWGKYHHILHPGTLQSPRHIAAVWVAADTALLADALTTALFFVPPARLQERYNFEYAIVNADGSLLHSPAFPGTFFTKG